MLLRYADGLAQELPLPPSQGVPDARAVHPDLGPNFPFSKLTIGPHHQSSG
jgi:hypothetical protein